MATIEELNPRPVSAPSSEPAATQIVNPSDNIAPPPEEIEAMQSQYERLQLSLEDQIMRIADAPMEIDTNALVGEINNRFSATRNRIMESALTSVKKQGLELDTYFGSPTGDQRSGARVRMAAAVKNSMLQSAFQTISSVYDKNTEMVISTQLEGAKLNLQAAATKAQAIAEFTGQSIQAYLGVLSETNKNYTARLSASVEWAQIQAQARGQDIQREVALRGQEIEMRGQDLQSSVAMRGQDLNYATALRDQDIEMRGQDIQREVAIRGQDTQVQIAQIQERSQAEQLQLERDKAQLQASLAVWLGQAWHTKEQWVPTLGGTPKSYYDLTVEKSYKYPGTGYTQTWRDYK